MRRIIGFIFYSIFPLLVMAERLTPYVNPFVGTDGYGNVYPGVQILMQIFMMQLLVINILIRH